MMKGDNLTEQISRRTQLDDDRQAKHQASFALLGRMPKTDIRRLGPLPSAPPRNLPGTCSRTLALLH
jgi:hypothetical protein